MNTKTTLRFSRTPGRAVAAMGLVMLLAATGASQVGAEDILVAYSDGSHQEIRADKAALDVAISRSAEQANAALTEEVRSELENRVRSKLRLARSRTSARG